LICKLSSSLLQEKAIIKSPIKIILFSFIIFLFE
jgi:hypothetical protein